MVDVRDLRSCPIRRLEWEPDKQVVLRGIRTLDFVFLQNKTKSVVYSLWESSTEMYTQGDDR